MKKIHRYNKNLSTSIKEKVVKNVKMSTFVKSNHEKTLPMSTSVNKY